MHSIYPVIVSEKSTAVQKKVQVNVDKLAICFAEGDVEKNKEERRKKVLRKWALVPPGTHDSNRRLRRHLYRPLGAISPSP